MDEKFRRKATANRQEFKPLSDDSALRALSSLRGLRGAPVVPPLCRETQSLGQQMLNATVGINGLSVQRCVWRLEVTVSSSFCRTPVVVPLCFDTNMCLKNLHFLLLPSKWYGTHCVCLTKSFKSHHACDLNIETYLYINLNIFRSAHQNISFWWADRKKVVHISFIWYRFHYFLYRIWSNIIEILDQQSDFADAIGIY